MRILRVGRQLSCSSNQSIANLLVCRLSSSQYVLSGFPERALVGLERGIGLHLVCADEIPTRSRAFIVVRNTSVPAYNIVVVVVVERSLVARASGVSK